MKTLLIAALITFGLNVVAFADSPLNSISTGRSEDEIKWNIELASDDESRSKGLMFRKQMLPNHGMLFRFESMQSVSMWMKNTFISLDMVFMDEQGGVTHIHKGAVPQSLDIISSNGPARYVLEINAGEAAQYNLSVGQRFEHPWFQPAN